MNLDQVTLLILCAAVSLLGGIIAGIITASIISKKNTYKKIKKILKNAGKAADYEELAEVVAQKIDENENEHSEIDKAIGILNLERKKNIKRVGYIRYDSTEDISGRLSFSLVLLNEENSGILLTNIHMIEGSSLYLREIVNGSCETNLSEEEKEVIKNTCLK
jgi:hypothetical protein